MTQKEEFSLSREQKLALVTFKLKLGDLIKAARGVANLGEDAPEERIRGVKYYPRTTMRCLESALRENSTPDEQAMAVSALFGAGKEELLNIAMRANVSGEVARETGLTENGRKFPRESYGDAAKVNEISRLADEAAERLKDMKTRHFSEEVGRSSVPSR